MEERKCTEVWQKYERGKQFNMSLTPNYYDLCNTNVEFYAGNQWRNLGNSRATAALPKPVFNIIKRIGSLFVASLTSSSTKVSYEPLANRSDTNFTDEQGLSDVEGKAQQIIEDKDSMSAAEMATSEVANLFDKLGMDYKIREALTDGIQTGDYCAHFFWNPNAKPFGGNYGMYRGEIEMELVDGVNVMFSNPNNRNVEDQNYIIIIGRDTVKNLKREYKMHHKDEEFGADQIMPDTDYQYQIGDGGHTEMPMGEDDKSGKALFMYYYKKKTQKVELKNEDGSPKMIRKLDESGKPIQKKLNGVPMVDIDGNPIYEEEKAYDYKTTVWVSKHTKFVDIFEPIDTGLSYYPIAWGNWQAQKNCYHGRALVTEVIPNQIFINSMYALVMRHLQMSGFPKTVYDGNVIGQWSNEVGQAIAVYDLPPEKRMSDLYSVIQPQDMSTQIMRCIETAMTFTKECLGATDATLGNVRPDNTSALIALQSSSQVPLENPQSEKYRWVEDIGRILLDMMGTYYGERPVVKHTTVSEQQIDPTTGMPTTTSKQVKVVEMYDFSKLKNIWLNVRADVGASTYWSRIAIVQTLDNLKQSGVLNVIQYLERMPDEYIPMKAELIAELRKEMEQPAQMPQVGGEIGPNPAVIGSMPNNTQEMLSGLSTRTQKNLLKQAEATTVGA